jgi:hypothetical protein
MCFFFHIKKSLDFQFKNTPLFTYNQFNNTQHGTFIVKKLKVHSFIVQYMLIRS